MGLIKKRKKSNQNEGGSLPKMEEKREKRRKILEKNDCKSAVKRVMETTKLSS
jgi:hypothetical protein